MVVVNLKLEITAVLEYVHWTVTVGGDVKGIVNITLFDTVFWYSAWTFWDIVPDNWVGAMFTSSKAFDRFSKSLLRIINLISIMILLLLN